MRLDQYIWRDRLLNQIWTLRRIERIRMRTNVRVRPAVEAAVLYGSEVIGWKVVAQFVPLIDRGPELSRSRLKSDAHCVAQAARKDSLPRSVRIVLRDRRAPLIALRGIVGRGTNRHIHLCAGRIECNVARPVLVVTKRSEIGDMLGLPLCFRLA